MRRAGFHESVNSSHSQETGFPHPPALPGLTEFRKGTWGWKKRGATESGPGRLWLRCCGAPVATLPPRLAAMSQHMQVHGAALFTGGSGNPVSVGGAVTSGAPRLRGRGPAPPRTWAGGARADEMCSVYKHATWPASCSLKPSRCTKRPLPPQEHVPAQGPGCGTRCGSSIMGLVTSLPSRTWGVGGSENSQGDQRPGAGRSPYVPIPLFLCVCVDPQTVLSAHTVHLRTNGRPSANTAQTSEFLETMPSGTARSVADPRPPAPTPLLALGWDTRDP